MQYLGGKNRIAKALTPIILANTPRYVYEPFCGALHITAALLRADPELVVYANDAHKDLIDMWCAVRDGWTPPTDMTKEEYLELKEAPSSPTRTFAGYACSFSGRWFGGFARNNRGDNFCRQGSNSVVALRPLLHRIRFSAGDYRDANYPEAAIIYADPPYAGTAKPGTGAAFDHGDFRAWVNSRPGEVYVSELTAPEGQPVIWARELRGDLRANSNRIEKLFTKAHSASGLIKLRTEPR